MSDPYGDELQKLIQEQPLPDACKVVIQAVRAGVKQSIAAIDAMKHTHLSEEQRQHLLTIAEQGIREADEVIDRLLTTTFLQRLITLEQSQHQQASRSDEDQQ
jgi:hypothetical protein